MSQAAQDRARAELRARQGAGARYDAETAPAEALLWARRGTAYFARKLNELDDDALYQPSAVPGWTRAMLVAKVSYAARHMCELLSAVHKGEAIPSVDLAAKAEEIERGSTLPPRALRSLFKHTEVHLNVE